MTWATTLTSGSGELAYRLEIERWPESWVTHQSMVNTGAAPQRLAGLKISGQKLKCVANPASNELDVSGFQAEIVDLNGEASESFRTWASARTWLTTGITAAATTMSVRSTSTFASSGTLWVDSEAIKYTGVSGGNTFTGLTRGHLSSLAQSHYTASVGRPRFPEVTNRPVSMAGCRCKLYVYGQNDDPQGSGTVIWQGVVTRHPTFSGASWNISVDPITTVLDRTVAADLAEPTLPRGIYYTAAMAFSFGVFRYDTGDSVQFSFPTTTSDRAFFENNADFATYVNERLATEIGAAWPGNEIQVLIVPDGDTSWHVEATTDGTAITINAGSSGESALVPENYIDPLFPAWPVDGSGATINPTLDWTADTVYRWYPGPGSRDGAGSVPRAAFGKGSSYSDLDTTFPPGRIYIGPGAALNADIDALALVWPDSDSPVYPTISAISAADGYIDTDVDILRSSGFLADVSAPLTFTAANLPELRFGRMWVKTGSVWSAIEAITAAVPVGLNAGAIPDVRAADFDTTAWSVLNDDSQPRIVRARTFTSFSESSLLDIIRPELTAAGYFLGISATGTITIAKLRPVVTGGTNAWPDATILTGRSIPSYEVDAYGHVSVLRYKRGYDPIEDEHTLSDVVVWDVGALSRNPAARTMAIEPRSVPANGVAETWAEVVETTARLFSVLSQPYARIQTSVPLTMFTSSVVGSAIKLTTDQLLPNAFTGARGVTDLACLVTGRDIDLSRGEIALRLLSVVSNASGYAPQQLISSATNVSGNTWDLDLEPTGYIDPGVHAQDVWVVGDEVSIASWDSTSTSTVAGNVISFPGADTVRVTFDASAAAILGTTAYLTYAASTTPVVSSQRTRMFLAASDGDLTFASDEPARAFA